MRIVIVTPAAARERTGNRVTALRWRRILEALGHHARIVSEFQGQRADLLIALHAFRSAPSVARFAAQHPGAPLIVALTGTDLYGDLHHGRRSKTAIASLDHASRIIVLQDHGVTALPARFRSQTVAIVQSVPRGPHVTRARGCQLCVVGHLRAVKDPLRAALAVRHLPSTSNIKIVHAGRGLSAGLDARARCESHANPRYNWVGELPRWKARRLIARSHGLVLSSRMEGGAHVVAEALVARTPVIASRIGGTIGMLGEDYPGYFATGDTHELRDLMLRLETDLPFGRELRRRCRQRAKAFAPARELAAWKRLLRNL